MRKPASLLILISFIMLFLGWIIGTFFTQRTVAKVVASIPASPIVVNAKYDKEKHAIYYSMLNPGGMPLTVVEESFVFTPGKNSKEKGYILSHIPVHVVLLPGAITQVELKLKAGTQKLQVGDAVLATFTYTHPLSKDIYTLVHPFTMGVKSTKAKKEEGGKK